MESKADIIDIAVQLRLTKRQSEGLDRKRDSDIKRLRMQRANP
jgi:hypothetical protein